MKRTVYTLTGCKTLNDAAQTVEKYLSGTKKMETQLLTMSDGTLVVQGRGRHDMVKQFIGLNKAITVRLSALQGQSFQMEVGNGEWLKKSLVMAVSMVVLWPLFVTSAVGIVTQSQLPFEIEQAMQRYLADLPLTEKRGRKEAGQAMPV